MAWDTAAERAAAAHVKRLGTGVVPGTFATDLGQAAAALSYWPEGGVPPVVADTHEHPVLGQWTPGEPILGRWG